MNNLIKRCDKLAYYGVPQNDGSMLYTKMTGFTEITTSKNPKEYKRQYVDEEFETSDVVGYSPAISYSFDRFFGNAVHDDIANITDKELLGADAVRTIVMVDMKNHNGQNFTAVKRDFSVIPDTEGNSMDAYTYSGSFKVNGEKVFGTASSNDEFETINFIE